MAVDEENEEVVDDEDDEEEGDAAEEDAEERAMEEEERQVDVESGVGEVGEEEMDLGDQELVDGGELLGVPGEFSRDASFDSSTFALPREDSPLTLFSFVYTIFSEEEAVPSTTRFEPAVEVSTSMPIERQIVEMIHAAGSHGMTFTVSISRLMYPFLVRISKLT